MTVKEFIQNYNLHDSLLEKVEYDKNDKMVKVIIDFCYWQQRSYNDDMPETGLILVQFDGVSNFDFINYQINSDEIIDVRCNKENGLLLTVFNDITNDYKEITVYSDNITVQKL